MRIDELYLREVGPFDELRVQFKPRAREDKADIAILTGPNGCGKSTILYAIASLFASGDANLVSPDLLQRRMRSLDALAAFRSGSAVQGASLRRQDHPAGPFEPDQSLYLYHRPSDRISFYRYPTGQSPFSAYREGTQRWNGVDVVRYDYAAFSYAGARSLEPTQVTAISEPTDAPLHTSLKFGSGDEGRRLAHWIALMDYKALGAHRDGDEAASARFERTRRTIEEAVSRLVEDRVAFAVRREPLSVLFKFGNRETDFDVLPDGLKSILSWVADVLMRLERTPWVDDTPPEQRPFLLLLDEIDIHLHPRWQRRVLPLVQTLFPRAQVIVSSHSPFVATSVADAWIYSFAVRDGKATLRDAALSAAGTSYMAAMRSVFEVEQEFDQETEDGLRRFRETRDRVLRGESPIQDLNALGAELESRGIEVAEMVSFELRQVERRLRQAQPR